MLFFSKPAEKWLLNFLHCREEILCTQKKKKIFSQESTLPLRYSKECQTHNTQ